MKIDKNDKLALAVLAKIKEVTDPEIGISVYDMGLIYGVEINKNKAIVTMTLTTPHCPMAAMIVDDVKDKAAEIEEIEEVVTDVVFDPPWSPEMIPEEIRRELGLGPN
ncbi:MAG: iron-sulfur cluster assembly protein [Patescibacteria group bacterium]